MSDAVSRMFLPVESWIDVLFFLTRHDAENLLFVCVHFRDTVTDNISKLPVRRACHVDCWWTYVELSAAGVKEEIKIEIDRRRNDSADYVRALQTISGQINENYRVTRLTLVLDAFNNEELITKPLNIFPKLRDVEWLSLWNEKRDHFARLELLDMHTFCSRFVLLRYFHIGHMPVNFDWRVLREGWLRRVSRFSADFAQDYESWTGRQPRMPDDNDLLRFILDRSHIAATTEKRVMLEEVIVSEKLIRVLVQAFTNNRVGRLTVEFGQRGYRQDPMETLRFSEHDETVRVRKHDSYATYQYKHAASGTQFFCTPLRFFISNVAETLKDCHYVRY